MTTARFSNALGRRASKLRLLGGREGRILPWVLVVAVIVWTSQEVTGYAQEQAPPPASAAPSNAAPEAQAPPASAVPGVAASASEAQAPPAGAAPGPAPGAATAEDLRQLVSPIALYPDLLVARILAASTYPDQVVAAYKWLEENQKLSHDQLASQVNA